MLHGNVSLFWRRANTSKQSKISKLVQAGTNTLPSNPLAIHTCIMFTSADPEGRTGGSDPPPLWFVRGGVLCRDVMGRRGGPTVVFTLLLSNFSGSLRSPVLYKRITYIHTFKFNIQSSFLYITLILMKRIQLTISCFHERASSCFSCLKLHDFTPFKTKIYWGGPTDPPHPTVTI